MGAQVIDATPLAVDLKLYAGDDFYLALVVSDPDTGDAADLTGVQAYAEIRTSPASEEVLADFLTTIVGNVITLQLMAMDSAALPAKSVWDCQVITVSGECVTLVSGKITMMPEVTR